MIITSKEGGTHYVDPPEKPSKKKEKEKEKEEKGGDDK